MTCTLYSSRWMCLYTEVKELLLFQTYMYVLYTEHYTRDSCLPCDNSKSSSDLMAIPSERDTAYYHRLTKLRHETSSLDLCGNPLIHFKNDQITRTQKGEKATFFRAFTFNASYRAFHCWYKSKRVFKPKTRVRGWG